MQKRLAALRDELNVYLAKSYSITDLPKQQKQFDAWKASHQPFHWFAEYYGIVHQRGGFDVIIGNPPYIELKELKRYEFKGYQCADAGNLYAVVLERCNRLNTPASGTMGFIVPVSSVSTDRYVSLQKLLTSRELHYSSFDDRPSRLFDGLEHIRLSVHLVGARTNQPTLHSTRYNKWSSAEREVLFDGLHFVSASPKLLPGSLPKLATEIESSVLTKLFSQRETMRSHLRKQSEQHIFYSRKVGYFLQILDFQPRVLDSNGKLRPPSEFKPLFFDNRALATSALCCLNSNLFNWFMTVFSDCRHVNRRELEAFPIDLVRLADGAVGKDLNKLGKQLMKELDAHSDTRVMKFGHDTLTVQCILPKSSKPILDEIDELLAGHYELSGEELDFIINYDIKYRMGSELEGDSE